MTILALFLLCVGTLAVLITAPFALFMPYKAFDDTERPVRVFLFVALFLVVPLSMGWCVYNGWQHYEQAEYVTAVQFAAYPTSVLVVGVFVITIATLRTKASAKNKPSGHSHAEKIPPPNVEPSSDESTRNF